MWRYSVQPLENSSFRSRSPSPVKVLNAPIPYMMRQQRSHSPPERIHVESPPPKVPASFLEFQRQTSSAGSNSSWTPHPIPVDSTSTAGYSPGWHDSPQSYLHASEYQYANFWDENSIRLLCLWPGSEDEVLYCSLKEKALAEVTTSQLQYQALSYVWGDEAADCRILIQHASGRGMRRMTIRPNLHSALRTIRDRNDPVWLWVDYICINQNDITEKARQISLMPEIYGHAWSVTIWLGSNDAHDGHTDLVMDFIPHVLNLKLLDRMVEQGTVPEDILQSFVRFAGLFKLPWFQRRWVIQELSLASRAAVRYGSKIMNWHDFADATVLFLTKLDRIKSLYQNSALYRLDPDAFQHVESSGAMALVEPSTDLVRKAGDGSVRDRVLSLESLLMKFQLFETSEPRDTIYSLLSLANDAPPAHEPKARANPHRLRWDLLRPRYDLSVVDTHIQVVNYCLKSTKSLDIICRTWAQGLEDIDKPSWIGVVGNSAFGPPSRLTGRINGDSLVGVPGKEWYDASRKKKASARVEMKATMGVSENLDNSLRTKSPESSEHMGTDESAVSDDVEPGHTDGAMIENTSNSSNVTQDSSREARNIVTSQIELGITKNIVKLSRKHKTNYLAHHLSQHKAACANCRRSKTRCSLHRPRCIRCLEHELRCEYLAHTSGSSEGLSEDTKPMTGSPASVLPSKSLYTGVLFAKGIQLGALSEVSARVVDGTISDDCLAILGWKKGEDVTSIPDQLWRTLCADKSPDGRSAPMWYKRACVYALSKTSAEGDLNTSKLIATESHPAASVEYLKRVQSVVWSRRMFSCDGGIVGFGARGIRSGDLLCILFGCSVPVILRPLEVEQKNNDGNHSGDAVRLVGECFVYGYMNGEAFIDGEARRDTIEFKIH